MDSETEVDVDKAEEYTTAWMDVIGTMGGENTFQYLLYIYKNKKNYYIITTI